MESSLVKCSGRDFVVISPLKGDHCKYKLPNNGYDPVDGEWLGWVIWSPTDCLLEKIKNVAIFFMKKSEVFQVHIDPAHTLSINLQILKQNWANG